MSFSFITKPPITPGDHERGQAFKAFKDGVYERSKIKRHYQTKYDRYHYWLPASMMPVVHFLKDYFRFLDALCNIPSEHRYRQTEYEYAETAIGIMHFIRNRISMSDPIVIGSANISPIPWAIFGPKTGTQNKMFRNHFGTPQDIFHYYNEIIWHTRGFNSIAIERPLSIKPDRDPLMTLVNIYDRSANYILAAALLLTADIIRYSGPDCGELRCLFTNDKRLHNEDFAAWIQTRNAIVEQRTFDFGEIWVKAGSRHSYTSTSQQFCHLSDRHHHEQKRKGYWEVEIRDVFSASHVDLLTHGEDVEYYGEMHPVQQQLLLPPPDNYKNLSKADLSDDDDQEIAKMERRLDQMMEPRIRENQIGLTDWIDMARGFSEELSDY